MSTFEAARPRISAGTTSGGQFATKRRGEAEVLLGGEPRRVHPRGSLADLGVPVGLQQGMGERDISSIKRRINEEAIDRAGARDAATRWHRWMALSSRGHQITLDSAQRLRDTAATQLRCSREVRNALTLAADGLDAIQEAEVDLIRSHERYRLADDDLRVLSGREPSSDSARKRVSNPCYSGQLMPYPEGVEGQAEAAPAQVADLPDDLALPDPAKGSRPGEWEGSATRFVALEDLDVDRVVGARAITLTPSGDLVCGRLQRGTDDGLFVVTPEGDRHMQGGGFIELVEEGGW